MTFKTSIKPLFYISKAFCTVAYNFDQNGFPKISKTNKTYMVRILLYSVTFILGNFFTGEMIATGSLDEMAFLLANIMLISLAIYGMIWSVITQKTQLHILRRLWDQDIKFVVWVEVAFLAILYTSMWGSAAYISDFDLVLVMEYIIFFVLPDVFVYTVLFQFLNNVIMLKQKLCLLNHEASADRKRQNIKVLAKTHQNLYLLSVKINKFYGFLCLWTVATYFLWITCDMYRFVNVIIVVKHKMDETLASSLIATFIHYLAVLVTVAICSSTKSESQRFKILFSRAVLESEDQRFAVKKKLCLALVHQNIKFTALDWFELDYALFYTMTGSIITYLIVLQQLNL